MKSKGFRALYGIFLLSILLFNMYILVFVLSTKTNLVNSILLYYQSLGSDKSDYYENVLNAYENTLFFSKIGLFVVIELIRNNIFRLEGQVKFSTSNNYLLIFWLAVFFILALIPYNYSIRVSIIIFILIILSYILVDTQHQHKNKKIYFTSIILSIIIVSTMFSRTISLSYYHRIDTPNKIVLTKKTTCFSNHTEIYCSKAYMNHMLTDYELEQAKISIKSKQGIELLQKFDYHILFTYYVNNSQAIVVDQYDLNVNEEQYEYTIDLHQFLDETMLKGNEFYYLGFEFKFLDKDVTLPNDFYESYEITFIKK